MCLDYGSFRARVKSRVRVIIGFGVGLGSPWSGLFVFRSRFSIKSRTNLVDI